MIISLLGMVLVFAPVYAKQATPMAEDPVLEEQVKAVSDELRCLVCQNQTIADSSAPLAVDLKTQVREMLSAGKTKVEILDYMVERYGDFVRYRPPVKPTTMLLWFGPMLFLVIGGSFLFLSLKRRSKRIASASASTLSEDESKQDR
ncbi:MAG: cytochrome c-type biogenesis protein CcmH [Gammaproteobacteria bacterium]|nr:cytochrome c-type biogenesis protein CcmH [Gammaproteobacteria bacterium]